MKIEACRFENNLFDDASIIVDCILDLEREYKIKTMIDNDCIEYFFIDIDIAHKVCELLRIESLQLNKSREVKNYDERRNKNITHVIYSSMTIQDHTESCISMMIIKLDQHSIILEKFWMKKHDVNYHDHDDSISFHFEHCSHLKSLEHSYSSTKKKDFFRKRIFSDQSEMRIESTENKEIKDFFEKTNNSKMILKKSTIIEFNERLNERSRRLNEHRRVNESWRKELKKIEISSSKILKKESKMNSFYDEISLKCDDEYLDDELKSAIEIHSIAAASFNILSRQKDVKIFAVFMKNLKIQLKKQESNTMIDSKSMMFFKYHDFLNVFFKKKIDILSSHKKHDHRIELEKEHESSHDYAFLYNLSKEKLQLVKKYLKEHLDKNFIKSSTASYVSSILFAKKSEDELRFCVNYRKLNAIIKKNRYSISLIAETIARLSKAKWMTKINIRHVFNRIRMHFKEDENLITFRIKYETYKYLIMSFELINESFTFQNFMNDTLMNYLNEFVVAYLDDIIVYSNNKKKHIQHVRKILQRLREANIQVDVNKCEFHTTETKFLNMIIDRDEIKMNLEKIRAIVEWSTSNHLKKIQTFLKFVNFYKRFIKNFSKIVKSLIRLTRKDQSFYWSENCQITFEQLKKRVIEASILSYFSSELETFLESDSFDYVSIEILSQKENDDHIKSVAYFFKTLFLVECNYEIYDKELLTIIRCFEQWRAELQSVEKFINVLIDHKSLEYFMTIKKLNRRQTRWTEFLAEFDFKIAYQSEKKNDKANSLTRRFEDRSVDESDDRNKHMHQTILSAEKVDAQVIQELNDTKENSDSKLSLFDRVKTTNQQDSTCSEIRKALLENKKSYDEMLLKKFRSIENTLFFKKKLWVFESDQLKLNIIRKIHDQSASEHSDIRRTCKYLHKWYYWSQMKETVERYVRNCHICKRSKASRDKYSRLLNSLSISNRSWMNIIMNFVTKLSKIKNDFNAILMIMNRLTKMHHYVSCIIEKENTFVEKTTRLLIDHVWKLHELSNTIISDRESQFISFVWKAVCETLKINVKLSTAFHSETDDQSEIANQKMKRYLRNYCNYQQDDWSKWLFMTKFVSNATISAFTELFAFMTNYEFESRMSFDSLQRETNDRLSAKKRILTQKAVIIIDKMKNIWDFIKKKLAITQEMQKKYADKHRTFSSEYELEDMIWLFIKNIKIERSFRKLNHKWIESYKIKKLLKNTCQLNLSSSMKIHDTFHISLLRFAATDSLTDQIQSSPFSIVIDDEEEYEINDILNSRYHYEKLQYKVAWIDHFSDKAWYSTKNFQDHSKKILNDYHRRYFSKLESDLRLIVIIETMLSQWIKDEHREAKQLIQDVLNKMKAKMKENDRKRSNKDSLETNLAY